MRTTVPATLPIFNDQDMEASYDRGRRLKGSIAANSLRGWRVALDGGVVMAQKLTGRSP